MKYHPTPLFALWLLACVAIAAGLCGCRDGRPTRVPVAGRVLIDGEPLGHGHVRFVPEGARPSGGLLDGDGRFCRHVSVRAQGNPTLTR